MFSRGRNAFIVFILAITSYELVNSMIHGKEADITKHPYHAGVLMTNGHFLCSGAIIGVKSIITAAHCVEGINISSLVVEAGNVLNYVALNWHPVSRIVQHPRYRKSSPGNSVYDFAILKIKDRFQISDELKVIRIAKNKTELDISRGTVTGWRPTDYGDETLQVATIPIITNSDCEKLVANLSVAINKYTFCMVHLSNTTAPCEINEGAPVVAQSLLYGVVAWSNPCRVARYPAVATWASTLRTWVKETFSLRISNHKNGTEHEHC